MLVSASDNSLDYRSLAKYNGRCSACSKCEAPYDQLCEFLEFPSHVPSDTIDIYRLADKDVHAFNRACRGAGVTVSMFTIRSGRTVPEPHVGITSAP